MQFTAKMSTDPAFSADVVPKFYLNASLALWYVKLYVFFRFAVVVLGRDLKLYIDKAFIVNSAIVSFESVINVFH